MKTLWFPACCLVLLGVLSALGLGHWLQLHQQSRWVVQLPRTPRAVTVSPSPSAPTPILPPPKSVADTTALQELRQRIMQLESSNRQLQQQLAETNRDLLTLQFRVDTHSESFRPLPVAETSPIPAALPVDPAELQGMDNSDEEPALLPTRAIPVTEESR